MKRSSSSTRILKFILPAVLLITITFNAVFITYDMILPSKLEEDIRLFHTRSQRFGMPVERATSVGASQLEGEGTGASFKDSKAEIPFGKADGRSASFKKRRKEKDVSKRRASAKNLPIIEQDRTWITVEAQSDKKHIYVSVDGNVVHQHKGESAQSRGLHVVVLSQHTGKLTASRIFDVYAFEQDKEIAKFLDSLQDGRVVVFIVKDEGAYNLKKVGRSAIKAFGSRLIDNLEWRNSFAFIGKKNYPWVVEDLHKPPKPDKWPVPAKARISIMLIPNSDACDYGTDDEGNRRREFCENYDGYGNVCKCDNFDAINIKAKPLHNNKLSNIPVAIIASNRPYYLYRMLRKLLSAHGADPKMMTVYIDDFNPAPAAVAKLFNIRAIQHKPVCSKNCRIQQHYKKSLTQTFDEFPKASAMIILEEDLEVSTDIFDYFSQTLPLLETDPSVYCISAWNDQGYKHAVKDPAMLYRVEIMPGLGWLLKRSLYKNELEPKWPGPTDYWDWDMWMRQDFMRKGRECIIPEVSRTFHFGSRGLNVNDWFQTLYFSTRVLNNVTGVIFDIEKVRKDNYEKELDKIIRGATLLDHTKNQCTHKEDFIPNTKEKTYIAYFQLDKTKRGETYEEMLQRFEHWYSLAGCFKIWDLNPRDFHYGLIRIWHKDNHIVFIGAPESPYSRYKPRHVKPIYLPRKKRS